MFRDRCAALAIAAAVIDAVPTVSTFAQSNTATFLPDPAAPPESDRIGNGAARVLRAVPAGQPIEALPQNLIVPPVFRDTVDAMMRRSPTFRRQCARIAQAPRMLVVLQWFQPRSSDHARARTVLSRTRDGRDLATVAIRTLDDPVELIAHELEHVIEQLDGVDLAAQLRRHDSGVYATGDSGGVFETTRAKRIGVQVAREVQ
jgi:hypothetical protein